MGVVRLFRGCPLSRVLIGSRHLHGFIAPSCERQFIGQGTARPGAAAGADLAHEAVGVQACGEGLPTGEGETHRAGLLVDSPVVGDMQRAIALRPRRSPRGPGLESEEANEPRGHRARGAPKRAVEDRARCLPVAGASWSLRSSLQGGGADRRGRPARRGSEGQARLRAMSGDHEGAPAASEPSGCRYRSRSCGAWRASTMRVAPMGEAGPPVGPLLMAAAVLTDRR
jgi:hypothetical protein